MPFFLEQPIHLKWYRFFNSSFLFLTLPYLPFSTGHACIYIYNIYIYILYLPFSTGHACIYIYNIYIYYIYICMHVRLKRANKEEKYRVKKTVSFEMYIYIYIYIYIYNRQTVSLNHNSSVWQDTRDASNWERNPANFSWIDNISS